MDKDIAKKIADHFIKQNESLIELSRELKEKCPEDTYKPFILKFAHVSALSFDIVDMVGKDHSQLNPYGKGKREE